MASFEGGPRGWSNAKSQALQERAAEVMPGSQTNFRGSLLNAPLFFTHARGARLWDVDGNEYIDLINAGGPGILGHSHPEYIEALKRQLDTMCSLGSGICQTEMDIELSEKIVRHVPCAERVRFCVTGSEAVHLAIRLARAHTKRPYFIRFQSHYHGWFDSVLGGVADASPADRPLPLESERDFFHTEGRAPDAFKYSFLLPWNDIDVLEATLEKYGHEVAMIHMEPILVNGGGCPPRPGYLERVRELCDEHGIVLSFDEVITGFRVGLGGAQAALGVTPDLATFGKALAGGLPMAAVAGKKEILDQLRVGKVAGAGTFNGYPLGVAASLATLKILEKDDGAVYKRIDLMQARLKEGLLEICERRGIPALVQGPRGVFFLLFTDKPVIYSFKELLHVDLPRQLKLYSLMPEEGTILMYGGRWYVSAALTEADVDRALESADRTLARL
ncbi:glutamate-1-semialdehyde 2,1-aminomutase [Sorangium cellulosum]|uniref:Glutamate-1-semialdehyde 2,1-aminomutase n=1 Tax=Sorangium cellulosum TaxID=56 RepID=A0A4P2QA59_SORCE|nr:aspartate aminotransferase family protein [Sorangium cellulosum]AUX26459.1 glutamate-1-semialdehyde 2,1-aminomutase [Sorangium cellulosum]